ncbi:LysE family translocator [Cohnella caldifontis]|uniref:LysE family translocator n=1 Tax=Cohnella caldifontis TaxID=3027471 RepID=UPI0023EAE4E8|nr:LysE family transporter [Cohnella sp. YIM B05605]
MEEVYSIFGILLALTVGVVSPGPSFVFIAQRSISVSRSDGLAAAIGMGIGGVAFAVLGLLGLHTILTAVPWVYAILKIAGGLYLLYIAYQVWRGSSQPLHIRESNPAGDSRRRSSLLLGLTTQLSNPKTAIVYGSIFAAMLPEHITFKYDALILPLVFLVEAGWYAIVAVALSSAAPRKAYARCKRWIDRTAAGVMSLLGIKLISS